MVGDKALEAAPAVNEVAIAAADSFAPVAAFQYLIDYVHLYTGFEWWASIAATALLIRLIFLPLRIHQLRVDKQFYHVILNMAKNVPSFVIGGTLWFTDLTTPDHSLRLPLLFALTYWFRIELDPRRETWPDHEYGYPASSNRHRCHCRTPLDQTVEISQDNSGIEPWTFLQKLGDAVFIPAGCPHQVRNLKTQATKFCLSSF